MNKKKLIELRCKAWGITENEYYCNQCSDFSLEDMVRAYRRGKNKGRAELEKSYEETQALLDKQIEATYKVVEELTKAKELIKKMLPLMPSGYNDMGNSDLIFEIREEAEQFLKEE